MPFTPIPDLFLSWKLRFKTKSIHIHISVSTLRQKRSTATISTNHTAIHAHCAWTDKWKPTKNSAQNFSCCKFIPPPHVDICCVIKCRLLLRKGQYQKEKVSIVCCFISTLLFVYMVTNVLLLYSLVSYSPGNQGRMFSDPEEKIMTRFQMFVVLFIHIRPQQQHLRIETESAADQRFSIFKRQIYQSHVDARCNCDKSFRFSYENIQRWTLVWLFHRSAGPSLTFLLCLKLTCGQSWLQSSWRNFTKVTDKM